MFPFSFYQTLLMFSQMIRDCYDVELSIVVIVIYKRFVTFSEYIAILTAKRNRISIKNFRLFFFSSTNMLISIIYVFTLVCRQELYLPWKAFSEHQ